MNTESQADTPARTWPMPATPRQLLRAVAARPVGPAAPAAVASGAWRSHAPAPDRITSRHHPNLAAEGAHHDRLTPGHASGTPLDPEPKCTPAIPRRHPVDPARAEHRRSRAANQRPGVLPLMVARRHAADRVDSRAGFEQGTKPLPTTPDRLATNAMHATTTGVSFLLLGAYVGVMRSLYIDNVWDSLRYTVGLQEKGP